MANKRIKIPLSQSDIDDLQSGRDIEFNWSFPVEGSKTNEWIDVLLFNEDN